MTDSAGFLMYAALYRLAVLAVGALAIWLGFRLFNNAGNQRTIESETGSVNAEGDGFKLTLTSILPGTYFALFGTVIISVMLWKGEPPQFAQKNVTETTEQGQRHTEEQSIRYNPSNLDGTTDAATEWDKLNANTTLAEAAEPLSIIAKSWQQEGKRIGEAVAMARLAADYGKEEDRADYFALLSELLLANGDEAKAVDALQRAAQRDPLYRTKLMQLQKRIEKGR
jgi:hypothetical protein